MHITESQSSTFLGKIMKDEDKQDLYLTLQEESVSFCQFWNCN